MTTSEGAYYYYYYIRATHYTMVATRQHMSTLASKLLLGSLLVAGVAARRQWTGKGSAEATISRCTDAPNWRSASGYTCIQYEENKYCTPNGTVGGGWQAAWGTLDQDKGNSLNATHACCACGGGLGWHPRSRAL